MFRSIFTRMISLFQTASGGLHWASVWALIGWLVAGALLLGSLRINRNDRISSFQKEQASAAEIGTTKTQLANAQKEAEAARKLAEELKKNQAPRTLTPEQQTLFLQYLAANPKGKIEFRCIVGNNEATAYANLLRTLFTKAGYEVVGPTQNFMSVGDAITGLQLKVLNPAAAPLHAGSIQKAFQSIGIEAGGAVDDSLPATNDTARIFVFGKN